MVVRLAVAFLLLTFAMPASAEDIEGSGEDEFGEALGVGAAWLLGVTSAIAVWNLTRRKWLLAWLGSSGNRNLIKPTMAIHRKWLMPIHGIAGTASLVVGLCHAWFMEWHWLLWVAMAGMGFLTVGGALLQWKWTPAKVRKGVYLLHAQQLIFLAVLALLVIGHALVD